MIHVAGVISAPDAAGFRARQCRGHAGDARRGDRRRRAPLRPRLLARRARAQAVALRRVQGARRGAGAQLGPRLGDRPPARGLRPRRQGDARAVPDGQARADADAAQGPRVGDPRRRPRAACCSRSPRPRRRRTAGRARRRQARRLDPPRVRPRARRRGRDQAGDRLLARNPASPRRPRRPAVARRRRPS